MNRLSFICSSRAHPPLPFDFNFFALSFPELCLRCLSPPQYLLSNPTSLHTGSWSIEAPTNAHHELLRDAVEEKLRKWQLLRQSQSRPISSHQANGANGRSHEQSDLEILAAVEEYRKHLGTAYENWKMTPDKKKQDIWLSECAKAFAREQETHNDTKRRLDLADQKIQLLSAQLTQRHQILEAQIYPSSSLPISREASNQIPMSDVFEYENLISKWKNRIQSTRSIQQPLPPSPWATSAPPNLNGNSTNGTHYTPTQSHPHHSNGVDQPLDEDEDLADAPGDEDDLDQANGIDKSMLDPTLRQSDIDGERQAGGRMLLGLREYDGPGGGNGHGAMDFGR